MSQKYCIEDNGIAILLDSSQDKTFSPGRYFFTICSKQMFHRHDRLPKSCSQTICGFLHKTRIRLAPQYFVMNGRESHDDHSPRRCIGNWSCLGYEELPFFQVYIYWYIFLGPINIPSQTFQAGNSRFGLPIQ